ncbi:MAG: PA2928 family protein [Dokdonella sp.]
MITSAGWLLLRQGSGNPLQSLFGLSNDGLQAALFQTAPLRTAQGGTDRIYLLSTQSQTLIFRSGRSITDVRTDYLHIDLWAIDATTATVAWRKRLRTYEGKEREGRILTAFDLLGADGTTLWLNLEGPLGVSLADGSVIADTARIEQRNPQLAGKIVNEDGYVAFGRNGLQLTLNDASQWRIDAADLSAAPRDTPVSHPDKIVPPANGRPSSTSSFQIRALTAGETWLGVLTDKEADALSHAPVIPGRDPNERPGALQQYLNANHVPSPLNDPLPQPYRLWRARVKQVSAAPPGWSKELPDRWGKRSEFSDYRMLPDSPSFLRAGLLRQHRDAEIPLWYRNPDSVIVLHVDKLGEAGRLQLTRIAGPRGAVVWQTPLPFVSLESVMRGENDLVLWGKGPDSAGDHKSGETVTLWKMTRIDTQTGKTIALDMTTESFTREAITWSTDAD